MTERPDGFTKAMNLVERHGYEDVREYVEQLDGGSTTTSDPEPPEDATEESEDDEPEEPEEPDTFAEGFAQTVESGDVTDYTVGDLQSNLGQVDDADLLEEAFRTDGRTTAQDAYADRYQELTGSDLEGDE